MDSEDCINISFGSAVGGFRIGSQINEVLSLMANEFPRTNMDIDLCPQKFGRGDDIHVSIPEWAVRLRFQPLSQKLYIIDIMNFKVNYSLNGTVLNSGESITLRGLQKALGPSFPGHFVEDGLYVLEFEGASLLFAVPPQHQAMYSDVSKLPVDLPDGSSPSLCRVYIHPYDFRMSDLGVQYPDTLLYSTSVSLQNRLEGSEGKRSRVVLLHLENGREGNIDLGMTPQEVVANLGNPDLCTLNTPRSSDPHAQRYEYTHLGVELFFARKSNLLYRVVLHTNAPFHYEFGHYNRCGFRISSSTVDDLVVTLPKSNGRKKDAKCRDDDEDPNNRTLDEYIDPSTDWSDAEALLSKWLERDGSAAVPTPTAAIKPVPAGCPLPPTRLYGYPQMYLVMEVSDAGKLVAVTILDPEILTV